MTYAKAMKLAAKDYLVLKHRDLVLRWSDEAWWKAVDETHTLLLRSGWRSILETLHLYGVYRDGE